ncbi:MAG: peptidylprolyl isomerase [Sphingobacteriaceae bacterium]|nr:peptidylprolyl isomerase [Sphingobacteriaceae bacterium]
MKKITMIIAALSFLSLGTFAQKKQKIKISKMDQEFLSKQPDGIYAKIETSKGTIITVLEHSKMPLTVANYVGLAEGTITNTARPLGTPYYDGLIFHRVIPSFMIQGGCPTKNGTGSPGYTFVDEMDAASDLAKTGYVRGTLAMANAGPNTNGSQFFIMHNNGSLPPSYTIFGHVVSGIEVVDSIATTPRNPSDKPLTDVTINKVIILRKGKEAEAFDAAKIFTSEQANFEKKKAEKLAAQKAEDEKALVELTKGFQKTASGLFYKIEAEGAGASPTATNTVKVHYEGKFMDGKIFDSSLQRGQPIEFGLNQVIAGWTEGVQLIKPGGKIKLVIPPALGYGERGYPGAIPPNAWLQFYVELIDFK